MIPVGTAASGYFQLETATCALVGGLNQSDGLRLFSCSRLCCEGPSTQIQSTDPDTQTADTI